MECHANHKHCWRQVNPLSSEITCKADNNDMHTVYHYHPCHLHQVGDTVINQDAISNLDILSYKDISYWSYLDTTYTFEYDLAGQLSKKITKAFAYENDTHAQLTKVTSLDSKNQDITEKTYYPDDVITRSTLPGAELTNDEFTAIAHLKSDDQFHISDPIQKETYIGGNKVNTTRYLYGEWHNLILPSIIRSSIGNNSLLDRIVFNDYNENGDLLQAQKKDDIPISYIYGNNNTSLLSETKNATINETGYTGFENNESNSFPIPGYATTEYSEDAFTGKHALMVSSEYGPGTTFNVGTNAKSHSGYMASVWVKGNKDAYLHIEVNHEWDTHDRAYNTEKTDGWHLLTVELPKIKIPHPEDPELRVSVYIGTDGEKAIFDDLRFQPMDAEMTTYTYEPLVGITSASDANNKPAIYQYDDFGRLILTRDYLGNILKKYDYHYKE